MFRERSVMFSEQRVLNVIICCQLWSQEVKLKVYTGWPKKRLIVFQDLITALVIDIFA